MHMKYHNAFLQAFTYSNYIAYISASYLKSLLIIALEHMACVMKCKQGTFLAVTLSEISSGMYLF